MANTNINMASANLAARNYVLSNSVEVIQDVTEGVGTQVPANTPTFTIKPIMSGLIKGLFLEVSASITNSSSTAAINLSNAGIGNLFSSVIFYDTASFMRISTTGAHLVLLNFLRFKNALGSIQTETNLAANLGANFNTVNVPSSIAASSTETVTFYMYVPFSYSPTDLRGSIWGNVSNSSVKLVLNVNPNAVSATDVVNSAYNGAAGVVNSVTVKAKQVYLLNLPLFQGSGFPAEFNLGGYVAPVNDLSTNYQLVQSSPNLSLADNNTSLIPYAAARSYLSSILVYNNGNVLNPGTDVNTIGIQQANSTVWLQSNPFFQSLLVEMKHGVDLPSGFYLLDRRHSPINTSTYGNMAISFQPSLVNSGAYVNVYDEFFSYTATVSSQSIGA